VTAAELTDVKTVVDIAGTIATTVAIGGGAVWAYYRFVRDRTYRPRLDLNMSARWLDVDDNRHLLARIQVRNIGASHVNLIQEGTGLRVRTMIVGDEAGRVAFEPSPVYEILASHEWIEPNETVSDDVLLLMPNVKRQPVLLEVRLIWKWRGTADHIEVRARRVMPVDGALAP
jgi:hypothetical protein